MPIPSRTFARTVLALLVLLLVSAGSGASAAPSPVTTMTVQVEAGGRSFSARLSYPTRGGPYPAVAFAHGFMVRSA